MKRWQDPPIETRRDVPRPYYFIRPYVPQPGSAGLQRIRKRISLGFCDETTMRKAQARKQEIMAPINQGKFILQAQIRFEELAKKYREARLSNLGSATQAKYDTHLANHILPVFGRSELADLDRQSIEAWLSQEAGPHVHGDAEYSGLAWWSLNDLKNILSAIFTAARDWDLWQGENPCTRVKLGPKIEKREKRLPSASDLERFLAALPDTAILPADSARLMVLTACTLGLRVSEVLALKPEDVEPLSGKLRVARRWHRGDMGPTKSAASRRPLQAGPLAELLVAVGRAKQYIFEREPGLPPDDRDLQQHVFRPAAEAVGIYHEGFGMHAFRRLNISWRQEVGATPFEAMRAAGHAKPDVTWLYTITDEARERAHVEAIWQRLMPVKGTVQ